MEDARLVLDYIDVLVWPVTVVVLLAVFRRQVFALFARLVRLDAAGVSVTFGETVRQAAQVVTLTDVEDIDAERSRVTQLDAVRLTPKTYTDARSVGEQYRAGKAVLLDMTLLDDSDAKRLVDFAAGLVFSQQGLIDRVTHKVFLLVPPAK